MKLLNHHNNRILEKTVLTFGNFDGIHRGHHQLIFNLLELSKEHNLKSVLLTFNPHTRSVININGINNVITPHKPKLTLLEKYNIDYISTIKFNRNFSRVKANIFVDNLIEYYNPSIILIGYDNKFGYKGEGDYNFLKSYLRDKNIQIVRFNEYDFDDFIIKSSMIKKLIKSGHIEKANTFLGREFALYGRIIEGMKIGKSLGFPTANLELLDAEQIIPKVGLYYVNFIDGIEKYKALCNVGYRPTFNDKNDLSIESYIIEDDEFDFYGREIQIEFLKYLREEINFSSKEQLINQIQMDVMNIKKISN